MKDVLKGLLNGRLIMLPRHYYAEALRLGKMGLAVLVLYPMRVVKK